MLNNDGTMSVNLTPSEYRMIVTALRARCDYGEIDDDTKKHYLIIRKLIVRRLVEEGEEPLK